MASIGARIKARRRELHMTQDVLASRAHMTQATLSAMENNPKAKTSSVAQLAASLGVSALWLAEGAGEMIPTGTPDVIYHDVSPEILRLAEKLSLLPADKLKAISVLLGIKL